MSIFLKAKISTLSAEARIIRKLEQRKRQQASKLRSKKHDGVDKVESVRMSLHNHRTIIVKKETRASHIAYCFMRGRKYREIENITHTLPNFAHALEIAQRFSAKDSRVVAQSWQEFLDEGKVKELEAQIREQGRAQVKVVRKPSTPGTKRNVNGI